jgi:thiol-disulfide isomerase/thioredoxin
MKKVILCYADWCGPCKSYKPILQKVTSELRIPVDYINADYDTLYTEKYGIRSIPTTLCFGPEGLLWQQSGIIQEAQLKAKLA